MNKILRLKIWLPLFAIGFFAICIGEGYFYYSNVSEHFYVRLLLNVQNAFKAFLFSPKIGIEDALSVVPTNGHELKRIISYVYATVVLLAPICTATAIFRTIELALRKRIRFFKGYRREKIFIFGFNSNTKILMDSIVKDKKRKRDIFLILDKKIDEADTLELLRKQIAIKVIDNVGTYSDEVKKVFLKINLYDASTIIFMDDSAIKNFTWYLSFDNFIREYQLPLYKRIFRENRFESEINCCVS